MEICSSYSKCPIRPHKLPVPIIQARMKINLDTCLSAFFYVFFFSDLISFSKPFMRDF